VAVFVFPFFGFAFLGRAVFVGSFFPLFLRRFCFRGRPIRLPTRLIIRHPVSSSGFKVSV